MNNIVSGLGGGQPEQDRAWKLEGIPAFTAGRLSPLFADCGSGLAPDGPGSLMHTVSDTRRQDVEAYVSLLTAQGAVRVFENHIGDNAFYQLRTPEGLLHLSFMAGSGVTRVILDKCESVSMDRFGGSAYEEKRGDTVLAQYSLHYGEMIRGTTCDCGMNYVCRLRDNSLIIIDGGEMEQATDAAITDYMSFLHELTDTSPGEKMTVSLWLCTHAHNDHCDFFSKIMRFHADELQVARAAFDFPDPDNVRHSPSAALARERLMTAYPDAAYAKLHAGSRFTIANAEIEVLLSAEDAVGLHEEKPFPGTNDTSILFTVTADGVKTLFLADCAWDIGEVLTDNYSADALRCDILQAAHHGINDIKDVYAKIRAERVLLPQCRDNMHARFGDVYGTLCREYGEDALLFAHDRTDVFTCRDGAVTHTVRAHTGEPWDGSEW